MFTDAKVLWICMLVRHTHFITCNVNSHKSYAVFKPMVNEHGCLHTVCVTFVFSDSIHSGASAEKGISCSCHLWTYVPLWFPMAGWACLLWKTSKKAPGSQNMAERWSIFKKRDVVEAMEVHLSEWDVNWYILDQNSQAQHIITLASMCVNMLHMHIHKKNHQICTDAWINRRRYAHPLMRYDGKVHRRTSSWVLGLQVLCASSYGGRILQWRTRHRQARQFCVRHERNAFRLSASLQKCSLGV